MKIAIYQMEVIPGKPQENMKKVNKWLASLEEEVEIVVLPEMWNTSYTLKELKDIVDEDGNEIVPFLKKQAKLFNVNIVAGSVAYKINENIYNRAFVVDKKGEIIESYDKAHLVPMLNEHHYLNSGDKKSQVFKVNGVEMGTIICFDLRFPELTRSLALEDAKVIFVPAEWPSSRINDWKILLQARAIENQVFIIGCNTVGKCLQHEFGGNTIVIAPDGTIVDRLGVEESTLIVNLDFDLQTQLRESIPIYSSLRNDLY